MVRDRAQELVALLRGEDFELRRPSADHAHDVLGERAGLGDGFVAFGSDRDGQRCEAVSGGKGVGENAVPEPIGPTKAIRSAAWAASASAASTLPSPVRSSKGT